MFELLVKINCHSRIKMLKLAAGNLLEKLYCLEINCDEMDRIVRFAHHGRGSTIVAAKICSNVVIFQNVTIGSNLRFNKVNETWENVGTPIIDENVVIADGAKVLGPILIGKNTVVAAGAIMTRDIPPDSIAFGVNQFKPKDPKYDLIFHPNMIDPQQITEANKIRMQKFNANIMG
jgi:serine O-acetyltransferase